MGGEIGVVAVLKGGLSREREVSLVSDAACSEGLRQAGFEVVELDVGRDIAQRLAEAGPAVCFNALHGPFGEDGSIQGLLNILGIPYTHSGVLASSVAMDKARSKQIAQASGLHVAKGGLVDRERFFRAPPARPYVIKPVNDGSRSTPSSCGIPERCPSVRRNGLSPAKRSSRI